ncbi:MAG: hypothetical protein J0L58_12235 [Burkholderiales bacterium]|uniref:hypothetical protein n=1 Tax=Inhella sp. TaxID=1921806 RepID=UPI001AC7A08B|nr:hypothetical protein [Burkholderiales bacterium]
MKYPTLRAAALLAVAPWALVAQAKPLTIANDAWRQSAFNDLAPMLRACLPRPEQTRLPSLPLAKPPVGELDTSFKLQEPATLGQGHWYRLGWRKSDGAVFIVAVPSPEGRAVTFGPVNETWSCLPGELRKELGSRS